MRIFNKRLKNLNSNNFGIFVLSMSTLALQALYTRLFSISLWYHFAFMIVSVALLGFGASGTYLSIFFKNDSDSKSRFYLSLFSFLFSITAILSYLIFNLIPFDSYRIAFDKTQLLYLLVWYIGLTSPFFFSGACLGILFSGESERVHRIYFYNLIGSSIGSFFVVVTIPIFGGEKLVLIISGLGILSSILFLPKHITKFAEHKNKFAKYENKFYKLSNRFTKFKNRLILVNIFLLILIITLVIFTPTFFKIRMAPQKTLSQLLHFPDSKIILTKWNAYSRVNVIESDKIHSAPGLSLKFPSPPPKQIGITIDGDDLSPITFYDNTKNTGDFLYYLPSNIAYILKPNSKVVLINPGGGLDILSAFQHNCKEITVVEENPILIKLLKEDFNDFSGNILSSSKVKVINEKGRNFISSSEYKYDLIFLCLNDSYKVVTAGTYSLGENYEYTVEAIKQYYNHLENDGILCVVRWLQLPPSESLKVFSTILTALEELDIENPDNHVCAIRTFSTSLIMVKNGNFLKEEKAIVRNFRDEMGYDLIYYSDINPDEVNKNIGMDKPYYFDTFSNIVGTNREDFIKEYEYDVRQTTDDRPFFFHFFKPGHIPKVLASYGRTWQPFGGGGYLILFVLLLISILLSLILIVVPLIIRGEKFKFKKSKWQIFVYFFLIGIGYLFIEIPLMQKFILYLGNPIYSISTVLFSILFFSGLGSLILGKDTKYFTLKICALLLLILLLLIVSPLLLKNLMGYAFYIRLLSCILILAPIGFLMGAPFPMGIRITSRVPPNLIPWAWSINGFASVISSILAAIIAISWGFNSVLIIAFFSYLLALLVLTLFKFK